MFARRNLTGLEPRKKSTGSIFIVLIFIHQVFKIIPKDIALKNNKNKKSEEIKGGGLRSHCVCVKNLRTYELGNLDNTRVQPKLVKKIGIRYFPSCEELSSKSNHKNEEIVLDLYQFKKTCLQGLVLLQNEAFRYQSPEEAGTHSEFYTPCAYSYVLDGKVFKVLNKSLLCHPRLKLHKEGN